MKILVTGADGMLGSNLVRILLDRKHEVSVFIHPSSTSKTLDDLEISRYYGCILRQNEVDAAVKGQEAVIHAAALTGLWPARSEKVREINIEGTRNAVNAALSHNIKRFVFIGSTSSVNAEGNLPGTNDVPAGRYGLDYIDSKFQALKLVMESHKTKGLPALAILPTFMIGSYDSLPGSGKIIHSVAKGKLRFYTRGGRNFVSVKDVAIAINNSLNTGRLGKCYITGHENLSFKDFLNKVSKIVSQPEPGICVPDWLVKTYGFMGDINGRIFKKPPMVSYPMARISCEKQFVSSDEAINELGMPQTRIEVAIEECYQWFIQNGYLKKQYDMKYLSSAK